MSLSESPQSVFAFGNTVYDFNSRTHLMGILNVTPDSFSDGGKFLNAESAVRRGVEMVRDGADILDVGGESTRPGSDPVSLDEELKRIIPVIRKLAAETGIPISVDTYKSDVAEQALDAGASIVNDISGMTYDERMRSLVAKRKASVVLMHMQGTPKTMQEHPVYADVVREIAEFLEEQARLAAEAGIKQIIVDPGIGFGKALDHNLTLMRELRTFRRLGYPVMVGPSRKSFIGSVLNLPVEERLEGTAAAVTACILRGASIVRVHDVKEMKRIALVADALKRKDE